MCQPGGRCRMVGDYLMFSKIIAVWKWLITWLCQSTFQCKPCHSHSWALAPENQWPHPQNSNAESDKGKKWSAGPLTKSGAAPWEFRPCGPHTWLHAPLTNISCYIHPLMLVWLGKCLIPFLCPDQCYSSIIHDSILSHWSSYKC